MPRLLPGGDTTRLRCRRCSPVRGTTERTHMLPYTPRPSGSLPSTGCGKRRGSIRPAHPHRFSHMAPRAAPYTHLPHFARRFGSDYPTTQVYCTLLGFRLRDPPLPTVFPTYDTQHAFPNMPGLNIPYLVTSVLGSVQLPTLDISGSHYKLRSPSFVVHWLFQRYLPFLLPTALPVRLGFSGLKTFFTLHYPYTPYL